MGRILEDVETQHLRSHPHERGLLQPFLPLFDVTRADTHTAFGSTVSLYFLKPERTTTEGFGFDREVLLVYSPYSTFEPRTIQLVNRFMTLVPARTRVEPLCFILVAEDQRLREHVSQVTTASVETKTIVPFSTIELDGADHHFISNRIRENFFSRDLFDIHQALVEDTYFFGRQPLIQDLLDKFRRGQNIGLFGLRKMGKTSVISKLRRLIDTNGLGYQAVIDAQDPAVYKQRWWTLLGTVVAHAGEVTGVIPTKGAAGFESAETAAPAFAASMNYIFSRLHAPKDRILIVIDEFEHLCPGLSLEEHWATDYLPFWQTIRAYQTRNSRLSGMVVGVNPRPAEQPSIGGRDNPLFSLLAKVFLPPFSETETKEMISTLGRYMGLRFDAPIYDYLRTRYGGHPMLIRLACSWIHKTLASQSKARPARVPLDLLQETEATRDASLTPYAKHILDVMTSWYPMEYEMLEMLCFDHAADYEELASQDPQLREHIQGYGLVVGTDSTVTSGFVRDYIRRTSKRTRPEDIKSAFVKDDAQVWTAELEQLAEAVVHSRTYAQELCAHFGLPLLFADDKLYAGAKLADLRVAPLSTSRDRFQTVVNILQQLFWDCMSPSMRGTAKGSYEALIEAANRVRCLRHWMQHPDLDDPAVRAVVVEFIQRQIGGFPMSTEEWSKLHIALMRDVVGALRDTQSRLFANRPPGR